MKSIFTALIFFTACTSYAQFSKEKFPPGILANEISGPTDYKIQPFDVLDYDAFLDMTKAPSLDMSGICAIRIHWREFEPGSKFFFHLRSLKVDSAFYNTQKISVAEIETPSSPTYHYEILPPAGTEAQDTAIITIHYSGTMTRELGGGNWGGVGKGENGPVFAMGVGIKNNYVSATQHWLPCYDHPSDKATFHAKFRVKKGHFAASNGILKTLAETDSTYICEWTENHPCATYLLTFAVDNYVPVELDGASVPVVLYTAPADTADTRKSFELVPDMVKTFERRFVPFPFDKVGYVNTPIGAMEHQTMISFPLYIVWERNPVNPVAAHELAHQWFGDLVSPQDFRHAWLAESFATYCESLWHEELKGHEGYIKDQDEKLGIYFTVATTPGREGVFPIYDFKRTPPSNNYPETIYKKGALVLGMLRYQLGDSLFFGSLRHYLNKYAFGIANTDSLQKTIEEYSGRDLQWFFDQWIYSKGRPQLKVEAYLSKGNEPTTVTLTQVQPTEYGLYKQLPVELSFTFYSEEPGQTSTIHKVVMMDSVQQTFVFDSVKAHFIAVNKGIHLRSMLRVTNLTTIDDKEAARDRGNLLLFPNPTENEVSLRLPADQLFGMTVQVRDILGKEVFSAGIPAGTSIFNFSTSQLLNGVYFVKVGNFAPLVLNVIK